MRHQLRYRKEEDDKITEREKTNQSDEPSQSNQPTVPIELEQPLSSAATKSADQENVRESTEEGSG